LQKYYIFLEKKYYTIKIFVLRNNNVFIQKDNSYMLNSDNIKNLAKEIGFDDCGISSVYVSDSYFENYNTWLSNNYNSDMYYLQKNSHIRKNPALLVENAKSVISVILNYYCEDFFKEKNFKISKYAYGIDYHIVIKDKLKFLYRKLKEIDPTINGRYFCDSAPIFERYFAQQSGLGFIGKNNCFISDEYGSFCFLGEIILDRELDYDVENKGECKSCNYCINACPTGALKEFSLDANKCISYHTIENKSEIPDKILKQKGDWMFGCDICQDVCPHNKQAKKHKHNVLEILPQIKDIDFELVNNLSELQFKEIYKNTALLRIRTKKNSFQN